MFRFLELELHGWDFWEPLRLPLDADVVVLSGPNGSGKTTMLDAIRQILHARRLSQNRRITHYLRQPNRPALLRAVVSNRADERGRRPFDRQRIFADEATLACALVPDGGAPEKRYAVLPGRVPARELQARLLEGRDWLRPEEYARLLEYAGVSRSLMHILALEQGRADELSRQSPRELFRWVMQARGSQQVLERYTDARHRFEDSAREVERQQAQLVRHEAELAELERKVRRLDRHDELVERVRDAEALVGAAELQARLADLHDIERKLPELRTKTTNLQTTVERLRRESDAEREALERQRERAATLREAALQATQACDAAIASHAGLTRDIEVLFTQRQELERLPIEDAAALEAALVQARKEHFEVASQHDRLKAELGDLDTRIADLERGVPRFPPEVERAVEALAAAGIRAELAARRVEIRDEDWAPAIESALGPRRYALCVAPENELRAARIARAHGFPGPIVTDVAAGAAAAGPLDLAPGSPAWIGEWGRALERTDSEHPPPGTSALARDGTRRDRFGLWVSRAGERVLGGGAVRAQLDAARTEREGKREARVRAARLRDEAASRVTALAVRLRDSERRQALALALERLPGCEADLARAARDVDARKTERDRAQAELAEAQRAVVVGEASLERREEEIASRERELDGNRTAVAEMQQRAAALEPAIETLRAQVEPELQRRAETGELSSAEMAERDLRQARTALAAFEAEGPIPEASVREERRALERNMDELQGHVRARQSEADAARAELDRCRGDYLQVVQSTLHDYARRARSLSELASARLEIELPRLENDDRSIDEAGIVVRIGFDGKPPAELGDTSHSGGQQVIAGLVLLMAMAETEGQSFFIVDEPFAHLSLDRVDDVGKFLRRSGAQFLITVPTTLDRGQLDPASLLIVLRKKPAGEAVAPMPIVART